MILSCLAEQQKLNHEEFKAAYKASSAQAADGTDAATLRLICLSLHDYASFKQLKSGRTTLANYIKQHRNDGSAGLLGIQVLMQRLEKELTVKWTQSNKNLDEKERIEALEKGAVQDQKRIKELQNQIEQLKNIEHIIKDRER
jgi:predicted RNase H-like nuclease (RuvC/YqgF family)